MILRLISTCIAASLWHWRMCQTDWKKGFPKLFTVMNSEDILCLMIENDAKAEKNISLVFSWTEKITCKRNFYPKVHEYRIKNTYYFPDIFFFISFRLWSRFFHFLNLVEILKSLIFTLYLMCLIFFSVKQKLSLW